MADKTSTTRELNIENLFVDGDTRTIKLKNPRVDITTAEIANLETLIKNGDGTQSLLIGDKYGSDFRRIEKVTRITKTTTDFDLGLNQ